MRKTALLLCLAIGASPLVAEPLALSVDDAVALALGASPEAYEEKLAADAAKRALDNRWNLFLPALSAGATAKIGDRLLTETALGSQAAGLDGALTLGAKLSLANGLPFDLADRRTALRRAELDAEDARARVERDARKAYYLLVSLEQDLANKARAAELAGERVRLAELRFERGLGSELDALRARLSERDAEAAYDAAVADYEKRKTAFRRMLGLEEGAALRLSSPLEQPAASPGIGDGDADAYRRGDDAAIDARADVRKAALAVEAAANASARYASVNRLPLLTLEASWNLSQALADPARDAYSVGAGLVFSPDAWIPGSRKDLELRALRETEERLRAAYAQARRDARDEVVDLLVDVASARSAVALAESRAGLAERILAGVQEAYDRGTATALELDDARLYLDSARQTLISSRYRYLALTIDLGYALGVNRQDRER